MKVWNRFTLSCPFSFYYYYQPCISPHLCAAPRCLSGFGLVNINTHNNKKSQSGPLGAYPQGLGVSAQNLIPRTWELIPRIWELVPRTWELKCWTGSWALRRLPPAANPQGWADPVPRLWASEAAPAYPGSEAAPLVKISKKCKG